TGSGSEVVVDRGSADHIEIGDVVVFYPRGSQPSRGRVSRVNERSAYVRFADRDVAIPIGTRAELTLPKSRFEVTSIPEAEPGTAQTELPEHPPWTYREDAWTPDQPLLAEIKAVRPKDRSTAVSGRVYVIADTTSTRGEKRSDSFYRIGTDINALNPFGKGGDLRIDGELNSRTTEIPDEGNESELLYRLDRLSYVRGGTRFTAPRTEYGRFLQYGMPEFGVLDGWEFVSNNSTSEYLGFSFGFMPEPDAEQQTGEDMQVAVNRRWILDDFDGLSVNGGYQKTFHKGDSDRDLFVIRVVRLPHDDWDFYGTAWVDLYGSEDVVKQSSLELTQLHLSSNRTYDDGSGLSFTYSTFRFPELLRKEFRPVDAGELLNGESSRFWIDGWKPTSKRTQVTGRIGTWSDEVESGGNAEVGFEIDDWVLDRSHATFALFGSNGRFSNAVGARFAYSLYTEAGSWDLFSELSLREQDDFSSSISDLPLAKLRLARSQQTRSGWDLRFYVQALSWQEDEAISIGVFGQRGF
ncbi:MAG: hypothetical protein ACI87A_002351, partial [Planctomycetota bacterium]